MKPRRIPIHGLNDYAGAGEEVERIYVGRFRDTISRLPNRLRLHRHDYYEVFYLEGNGAHFNDFLVFPITAPTLVFVSPGQVHRWHDADRLQGWIVCFTQELFDGGLPPPSPLLKHSFWYPDNTPPVLALPADATEEMHAIFVEMQREYANKSTGFEEALGALLKMLFIRSERICQQAHTNIEPGRSSALMREFRLALEENLRTTQSVSDYAKLLKVSSDRLGKAVQERSGRPAGEIIRRRLLLEAQRLLAHTEMAVSEIAYALNFQSYMADKELLSQEMTRKHRLTPIFYDRLVSWAFGDFIFHSTFDDVSSTIKARRVGFHECIDTEGMFIELFSELRENRVIPPLV